MTEQYTPPFEGGKDPDPTTKAKTANRAKRLARRAMKKAAAVKESAPERPYRRVYEPTSAKELNPGLRAEIDAASNAQKPAPAGRRPIGKIKLMTRKEEVEQVDEAERTKAQIAAVNNRKAGRELGAKVAQEYHDNVRAKGIHVGHPEHTELYNKHTDKMSYLTLKRKHSETRTNHMSNAAHDTFHSNIRKLHDTAMKKDPGYKAKYEQHQADRAKRSAKAEIEYQAANAKIDKLRGEHHTGSPSHIEAINKVRKEHGHEITQSALYNHYGDGDGNLPTWAGGHGTNAERAKHHYNMYVAGTGGHGDRGYRYEEVELEEAKDNREYDYEGDMAMSQLKSVIANAQKLHDMLDPDTNLPEWVQSKITLAEDYIVTAANYMDGEMNEENTNRQVEPPPSAMPSDTRVIKPLPKKGNRTTGSFNRFGNFTPGMKEDVEQVKENRRMGYGKLASAIKDRVARKKLAVEAHDAVGEEDADINNDGKTDKTDVYLHTKRRAIGKAISTRLATKAGK